MMNLKMTAYDTGMDEGVMIDVDEFDRVVDEALDDVEMVEETGG